MRNRWIVGLVGASTVAVVLGAFPRGAYAIPEWARKYRTSCATCHEAFPRLNATGESFRLNGYKFPENDDLYVEVEPVEMGVEAYKKVFPDAVWPSDIPGMPPIAFRWTGDLTIDIGGENEGRTVFGFPGRAALLAGGRFGDSMSFFTELAFEAEGGHDVEIELAGYLNFEDFFSETIGENVLNFRVGVIGMQELDLPGSRDHQRIGRFHYMKSMRMLPYPMMRFGPMFMSDGGQMEMTWEFEEVNGFMLHHQPGVMLYGFGDFWKYAVGVVNGIHAEIEDGEMETAHFADNNSEKDVFFQLAFKIGGMGYDGTLAEGGEAAEELGSTPSGGWVDNSIQFGFFGYFGNATIEGENHATEKEFREDDSFWRLGVDVRGKYEDFAATVGAMWGHHENPYGAVTSGDIRSFEWLAEVEWFALPWLIPTLRYEHLNLHLPHGLTGALGAMPVMGDPFLLGNPVVLARDQEIARLIFELNMLVRANVKVSLFSVFYLENDPRERHPSGETDDDNMIGLMIDIAF